MSILRTGPGGNAWRIERAGRAALLVDADAYFRAVHHALLRARRQVLILGWDLDTRLCLRRDLDARGRRQATLGPLLRALAAGAGGPECFVLSWDFALIYALEREALTQLKLSFPVQRRLHVELDGMHPVGASHHQKVVVVDDALAFCGGLDLCGARWDTPAHAPHEPLRHDPPLPPHGPFHDVQMVVTGPVAAALGALARERWFRATGQRLEAPTQAPGERAAPDGRTAAEGLWPPGLDVGFCEVPVGVARTEPSFNGRSEVREVERLHLEGIGAARRHIYVENQYLTSRSVGAALAARLGEPRGPEVVIVAPSACSGWLETSTMGVLRRHLVTELRRADRYGRLRLFHPTVAEGMVRLNVHSKVTIIDNALLRVGSANLSNRSMGLDTECDLAIEATTPGQAAAIAAARAALLAEHLGVPAIEVERATAAIGLIGAVERLRRPVPLNARVPRTLAPLDVEVAPALASLARAGPLVDPSGTIAADPSANRELPETRPARRGSAPRLVVAIGAAALLLLTLGALLSPAPTPGALLELGSAVATLRAQLWTPWGVAAGVVAYVVGGLMGAPLVALHALAAVLWGPSRGWTVAMPGSVASAAALWQMGHLLGVTVTGRLAGRARVDATRALRARGVFAVAALRLLPVGPFSTLSLAAGAAGIPRAPYLVGTLVGVVPGVLATAALVGVVEAALRHPAPAVLAAGIVEVLVLGAVLWSLARWVHRRQRAAPPLPSMPA